MRTWQIVLTGIVLVIASCAPGHKHHAGDDVVRSCDDIDVGGYGDPVAFETLRCGDEEVFGYNDGAWTGYHPNADYGTYTYVIRDQADLDAVLSASYLPCPVDFAQYIVVGGLYEAPSEPEDVAPSAELCAVRSDGQSVQATAFINRGAGPTFAFTDFTVFHFVTVPATSLPVSVQVVYYNPRTDTNE
jgi:hypothetical protein